MDDGELIDDEACAGTKRNISIQTQGRSKRSGWSGFGQVPFY